MKLVVLREAEHEFWEAVTYYELKEVGLGVRFKDEVDRHLDWIGKHPELPSLRRGGFRRVNLSVFRHYIAYVVRGETIWILAICHSHRFPDFWKTRRTP